MIRTARLILRDFQPSDLVAYCELRSHPDVQRFQAAHEGSAERSAELMGEFLNWAAENPRYRYQLAVEERRLGLIGSCGIRITDPDHLQASFGCELGREYWGQGYAIEAARALIDFAFSELRIHRIHAEAVAENRSALSLARKLGMRIEGIHRECRPFRGRWRDTVTLAILSTEWEG